MKCVVSGPDDAFPMLLGTHEHANCSHPQVNQQEETMFFLELSPCIACLHS